MGDCSPSIDWRTKHIGAEAFKSPSRRGSRIKKLAIREFPMESTSQEILQGIRTLPESKANLKAIAEGLVSGPKEYVELSYLIEAAKIECAKGIENLRQLRPPKLSVRTLKV